MPFAGQWGPEGLEFPDGGHARNTPVTVQDKDGALATLYSDSTMSETVANPASADELGNFTFFAAPGEYYLVFDSYRIKIRVQSNTLSALDDVDLSGSVTGQALVLEGERIVPRTLNGGAPVRGSVINIVKGATPELPISAQPGDWYIEVREDDIELFEVETI